MVSKFEQEIRDHVASLTDDEKKTLIISECMKSSPRSHVIEIYVNLGLPFDYVNKKGAGILHILSRKKENAPMQSWYLVDLPGYGFAKVSAGQRKKWEKMIEGYIRQRENLVNLFVLVDARHTPQALDLEFVNKMGEWQVPFGIVFTKADKETQKTVAQNVRLFSEALLKQWEELPPMWVTSAEKRLGRDSLLEFITEMNVAFSERQKNS